eukprot:COSAG06_NODE_5194_length_3646_cov_7.440372_3_plen_186_part_00
MCDDRWRTGVVHAEAHRFEARAVARRASPAQTDKQNQPASSRDTSKRGSSAPVRRPGLIETISCRLPLGLERDALRLRAISDVSLGRCAHAPGAVSRRLAKLELVRCRQLLFLHITLSYVYAPSTQPMRHTHIWIRECVPFGKCVLFQMSCKHRKAQTLRHLAQFRARQGNKSIAMRDVAWRGVA